MSEGIFWECCYFPFGGCQAHLLFETRLMAIGEEMSTMATGRNGLKGRGYGTLSCITHPTTEVCFYHQSMLDMILLSIINVHDCLWCDWAAIHIAFVNN